MMLINVPKILDSQSLWLRDEANRDALRLFLEDYDIDITDTSDIVFEPKYMKVRIYLPGLVGNRLMDPVTKEFAVAVHEIGYKPGNIPQVRHLPPDQFELVRRP